MAVVWSGSLLHVACSRVASYCNWIREYYHTKELLTVWNVKGSSSQFVPGMRIILYFTLSPNFIIWNNQLRLRMVPYSTLELQLECYYLYEIRRESVEAFLSLYHKRIRGLFYKITSYPLNDASFKASKRVMFFILRNNWLWQNVHASNVHSFAQSTRN